MKGSIYIPTYCWAADKHLGVALKKGLYVLTKLEFNRGWCSLAFLHPALQPDGFASRASGWPKHLKPLAV